MEIIGHEAFHFWKGTKARDAYIEILQDNLNFSSLAFMEYQRTFQRFYFDEAVDLFDAKQMELFQEELFAYISGDIHEGTKDAKLAPMFRDFEAVKAAWKALVAESRMGSGALKDSGEEGDMGGQPYPDDDPLVREIHRLFGRREEKEEGED